MTFSPDPRKNPCCRRGGEALQGQGHQPRAMVYTYAALQAWKQAAEKARSVEKGEIVEAMNDAEFGP